MVQARKQAILSFLLGQLLKSSSPENENEPYYYWTHLYDRTSVKYMDRNEGMYAAVLPQYFVSDYSSSGFATKTRVQQSHNRLTLIKPMHDLEYLASLYLAYKVCKRFVKNCCYGFPGLLPAWEKRFLSVEHPPKPS